MIAGELYTDRDVFARTPTTFKLPIYKALEFSEWPRPNLVSFNNRAQIQQRSFSAKIWSKMASEQELSTSFIPALYKPAALLPIARHKKKLLYLVEKYPVTIVVGQTGSGKTTQLPQYLDQAGWCEDGKTIAVTQVRTDPILIQIK